jgi:competence protein ComEC
MSKKSLIIFIVISLIAILSIYYSSATPPDFKWTMVDVNYSTQQADAHVITVENGKTILIDAGHRSTAKKSLIPFLQKEAIHEFDTVFISHPHKDHYGGLEALLDNDIKIREIYFNIPNKAVCDREIPWGCDYDDVQALHNKLKNKGVIIKIAVAGQKYNLGKDTRMEILYAFDGIHTPVGKTDVNDLSLIMMLRHNQFNFLFTGDLNHKIGSYIAASSDNIDADILKVPHHGAEVVAPNTFFQKVAPAHALVPAPKELWLSKRSERVRKWFLNNDIPVYVNGISGHVTVAVNGNNLTIQTEKNSK